MKEVLLLESFFHYNWQIREEWFEWCESLSEEELLIQREGGVNSFIYTFFHIIDAEYSWLRGVLGKSDIAFTFTDYNTLEKIKILSHQTKHEILQWMPLLVSDDGAKKVEVSWDENLYTKDEILHHVIAHEIHHIGQLSVWARQMGHKPVSANFIGRNLMRKL
ncbi:DinB family protein [Alkalihalobacillus sp. LMS39]|uniref:DinB family protein n=1 Tax=Alkalihalobacillus sp. LMS39 TaxID=2924032 RepID=UPI001FB44507|nr:DinB family protein [Alkalihalobacillus sp. LMS39]UOE92171.1 DinB family protein [Alkalihalobacillus sp. LMS39]